MKTKLLLTVAALCIMLGACKKKGVAPKQQIKLLSKITEVSGPNGDDTTITLMSYDSKNRLIKRGAWNYTYNGDDLVKIGYGQGTGSTNYTFTYNNGVPVTMRLQAPPLDETYTYTVVDGRVTKRTGRPGYSFVFTYANDNLASYKIVTYANPTTNEYGLDKNPYYNPTAKYLLLTANDQENDYISKNAVIQSYYQHYPYLGSQYNYLPGADGYPKSVIIKVNKPNDPDSFNYAYLSFEYVMRDVAQ
ncbi:hypothetical protein [Mucilaginibacter sp. UR6-11]|uniref:hypothetical protein n=1 Tax=Mucilaginibacter sp. UR6-11 TaxID=1435644 RepID=UPI001E558B36|nr:hypothetical protein [Mucilaginibacter sp. UR6-11]MCC8424004.1 hypothetical protein [Mucilaginibacter sp. UR6-11]